MTKFEIVSDILLSTLKLFVIYQIFLLFGIFRTFAILYLYYKIYDFFIKKYFNLERVAAADRVFIGKRKMDKYNVVIVLKVKDYKETKMKEFLIERVIKKFPKFSQILVEISNNYFWKDVPLERAVANVKNIQTEIINNEHDLTNYINTQANTPTDIFNNFGYEFHLIKFNDRPNEGALIFKFDHAFSDGLGALSVIACISDNYDYSLFPRIMHRKNHLSISNLLSISFIWKLFHDFITLPYIFYKSSSFFNPNHVLNPINKKRTGESIISISKVYNFELLFERCKKLRLSFNELMIANFSAGLKQYLKRYENQSCVKVPTSLIVAIPIGNREIPKDPSQIHLGNIANVAHVKLPIIDDPIKDYHLISNSLKSSIGNIFMHMMNKAFIIIMLEAVPKFVYDFLKEFFIKHVDMCVSNVPGSKKALIYSGSEVYDIVPVVNSGLTFSFTLILTYNNNLRFHIAVDKVLGINPKDIIECLETTLDKMIVN